jgi:hypothetical protein
LTQPGKKKKLYSFFHFIIMMQIEKKVGEAYPELDSVINFFQRTSASAFEQIYEDGLKIIAAEPNKLTWQFIVEDKHTNR